MTKQEKLVFDPETVKLQERSHCELNRLEAIWFWRHLAGRDSWGTVRLFERFSLLSYHSLSSHL